MILHTLEPLLLQGGGGEVPKCSSSKPEISLLHTVAQEDELPYAGTFFPAPAGACCQRLSSLPEEVSGGNNVEAES